MPLILPPGLPAAKSLQYENIFTMTSARAMSQDIRPLEILIVNLMPNKEITETQLARVLANTPLQVRLTLLHMGSHESSHTSREHLSAFYSTLDEVRQHRFDGMIVTGAPIEHLDYEQVDYWEEFKEIVEFGRKNVYSVIYLCWAALAGLYYRYGVPKVMMSRKLHGVFEHRVMRPGNPLMRGIDEIFAVPHSRSAGVSAADVENVPELRVLAESDEAGLHILSTDSGREIYVLGHMEYDRDTLLNEYRRDTNAGNTPPIPRHYFVDDDPDKGIIFRWRSYGHLFYSNWLNYYVYQQTPYNLSELN